MNRSNSLVVAMPVSKPNKNVPMAANSAMPNVYHKPIVKLIRDVKEGEDVESRAKDERTSR